MKSKYIGKIVFYDNKIYVNIRNKSPYWFILNIEKQGDDSGYIVYRVDRLGNYGNLEVAKDFFRKIEIVDTNKVRYLTRDFIKNIFKGE